MNREEPKIIIAIDGHSSCGKSTMAKWLAQRVGYTYIDTGAMFRAVTLYTIQKGLWKDENEPSSHEIEACLPEISISFNKVNGHTLLNGEDVEKEIRSMNVSSKVSYISTIGAVRALLLKQQREMGKNKGIVMDGRDICTAVFPEAELKLFVTADAEVRAKRRYQELVQKGEDIKFEEVLFNVRERDRIDSSREIAPLKPSPDAHLLDNSSLTIDQQNNKLFKLFNATMANLMQNDR